MTKYLFGIIHHSQYNKQLISMTYSYAVPSSGEPMQTKYRSGADMTSMRHFAAGCLNMMMS
jgi:hypothetical protein